MANTTATRQTVELPFTFDPDVDRNGPKDLEICVCCDKEALAVWFTGSWTSWLCLHCGDTGSEDSGRQVVNG